MHAGLHGVEPDQREEGRDADASGDRGPPPAGASRQPSRAAALTQRLRQPDQRGAQLIAALFVGGFVVRIAAVATFWPAWYVNPDSIGYALAANGDLYSQVGHPVGYPFFLRVVHGVTHHLAAVTLLQHALGLAAAALLYLAVRELGGSRITAAIPAAVVLLAGDQIFFEHAIESEALFTFLLVATVYATVRSTRPTAKPRVAVAWLVSAGVLVGLATAVREIGLLIAPVMLAWALWQGPGRVRVRVATVAAAAVAAAAVIGLYVVAQNDATGYTGLTRTGGWSLYARTAQFADCSQFDPPAGTAGLCERLPSRLRAGPSFYHWNGASPAFHVFGLPPAGDAKLGEFGRAAVTHQFGTYVTTVGADELRYFGLHLQQRRPYGGTEPAGLAFGTGEQFRPQANMTFATYYSDVHLKSKQASNALETYQRIVRLHPPLLALLALLALAGVFACTGRARAAVVLFGGTALVVMAVPPVTLIWAWRYGVPAHGLLAAAAAFGGAGLLDRTRARRRRPRRAVAN